jgi:hypothetical protein
VAVVAVGLVLVVLYFNLDVRRRLGFTSSKHRHHGGGEVVVDDDDDKIITTPSSLDDEDDEDNGQEDDEEDDKEVAEEKDNDDRGGGKDEAAAARPAAAVSAADASASTGQVHDQTACDKDCQSFRNQLASWPSDKPKAVIYYLIHRPALKSLVKSIKSVDDNFNHKYKYPIVVFVEENLNNDQDRRRIHSMTDTSPLYIQVVHFDIPSYVNRSAVPRMAGFGARKRTIGYRHMCRFHAGGVYEQPIMKSPGLEYGWRLDDDSLIKKSIGYDVFAMMRERNWQYGYHKINEGWSPVDKDLWDAVDRYIEKTSLVPTFYRQWPKNAARYFNNFEISDLRVWMSKPYQDYFSFIDHLGGIYYYKWGDAAIKTIAVTLFIPREKTHLFSDIAYAHT